MQNNFPREALTCFFILPSFFFLPRPGRHGFAPCSRRLRAGTSLSKFATRNRRDAKAELNRRSQACEVLADTGIRVAKVFPSAPKPASGHYFDRARPLPGSERRQKDECRLKKPVSASREDDFAKRGRRRYRLWQKTSPRAKTLALEQGQPSPQSMRR